MQQSQTVIWAQAAHLMIQPLRVAYRGGTRTNQNEQALVVQLSQHQLSERPKSRADIPEGDQVMPIAVS